MAITKKSTANNCECNKPEALMEIPHPCCPCPEPPMPLTLWHSYDEAVNAVNDIHLKPGEVHTEFYILNGMYHCVIGVGNIKPNTKHLILVDNGGNDYNTDISKLKSDVSYILKALKDINTKEADTDKVISNLTKQLNDLKLSVAKNTQDIKDINVNITKITNNVNKLSSTVNNVVTDINSINTHLTNIDKKQTATDNNVAKLSESINNIADNIVDINDEIDDINNHLEDIDEKIASIPDVSINSIPAEDIVKLFHDDIYTVNLCCYTEAGHIEIIDKDGYDRARVAECTPDNQYKTYVLGDTVSFKAVVNDGYTFKGWWKDGVDLHKSDLELSNIEFNDDNIFEPALGINLIGTLANGVERDILKHGYTALFGKRRRITLNKHIFPSETSLDNVRVIVKVNGNIVKGPEYYFDEGDSVEIKAVCQKPYKFDKFVVNGIEYPYEYVNECTTEDLNADAYFIESRYKIQAEPNDGFMGDIIKDPDVNSVIEGGSIKLTAVPETGIEFERWIENTGSTLSNKAELVLSNVSRDYSLIAMFKKIEYTVMFYDISESVIGTGKVAFGEVVSSDIVPDVEKDIPTSASHGFTFKGWFLHAISEKHVLDVEIKPDVTRVDASMDPDNDKVLHVYAKYDKY